ncbi:hypothetical protein WA026_017663 [Henosepilachna vigintioctopunctata]|uniref:Uroporphyrinogen-III synthase n=1 Tax=Henosepilachna vigintioctopunctata TaxID=420089 RepID=A0AAW1U0I4_9CUCU
MRILENFVILLKAQRGLEESDSYEKLLNSHGYVVKQVNTLVFEFHDLSELKEKLESSKKYSGLLLSSPRCVEAVYFALNKNKLESSWHGKHNYAVGEATHLVALKKLGINCRGKESGNAKNLSSIVAKENIGTDKPFLFPHGNLKTDTLKIELSKSNISIEGVLVYDTLSNPNIEEEFADVTEKFTLFPEYIIFFSPSGVRSSVEILRKSPGCLNKMKCIAIGPVTETSMKEENFNIYGVAASPNPEEVLNIIKR